MNIKASIEALEQAASTFKQNAEEVIQVPGGLDTLANQTLAHWTGTAHEKFIQSYQETQKMGQQVIEILLQIGDELQKQAQAYQEVDQSVKF